MPRTRQTMLIASEQRRKYRKRRLLENLAAKRLARQAPAFPQLPHDLLKRGMGLKGICPSFEALCEVTGIEREQNRVRFKFVEWRARVGQLLEVLAEGAFICRQRNA